MTGAEAASQALWVATAERERPSVRAVAGRLMVTETTLRFLPRTAEPPWEAELSAIVDVGIIDWPPTMGSGRHRKRVRVETLDGEMEIFAVAAVSHAVEFIRVAVRVAGGDPDS